MLYIIYAVHVIICLFLIMVVLLQQGSGADLSVFGGGGTQTAFGARSATSLLHKLTVAGFVGFILTTIAFGFLTTGGGGGSVMSGVEQALPSEDTGAVQDAISVEPDGTDQEDASETLAPEDVGPAAESDADNEPLTPTAGDGGDDAATPDTP